MSLKVLDCTIRDGGHLNRWHFDSEAVKAAYFAATRAGVDYFEVGYRFPESVTDVGEFGRCTDAFLFQLLERRDRCRLTVMVDAGKCDLAQFSQCSPDQTLVSAVRVAAYPYELAKAVGQVEALHAKGYEVFLNLMASSEATEQELSVLREWKGKEALSAIYFADSFGSMMPSDVGPLVERLRSLGFSRIGFHPHNNLQMAFANTLRAIESGVEIVDASIYGMGRGAGNLPVEILVGYLERLGERGYNTVPYLSAIERYFEQLRAKLGWGYTLPGLMSGIANVHPYYVDHLVKASLYTTDEIWNALGTIKASCPISFSAAKMSEALDQRPYSPLTREQAVEVCRGLAEQLHSRPAPDSILAGDDGLSGRHRGRKFLILATGPSVLEQQAALRELIERQRCVVIGVNNLQQLFKPDYHLFVSRRRFEQYAGSVWPDSQLLVPSFFGKQFTESQYAKPYRFFDCVAPGDPDRDPLEGGTQHLGHLNVAVSAILLAAQMGAETIYAAGMDGFSDEATKQMTYFYDENNRVDDKLTASTRYGLLARELERVNGYLERRSVPFCIVTPTSHRKYYRSLSKI